MKGIKNDIQKNSVTKRKLHYCAGNFLSRKNAICGENQVFPIPTNYNENTSLGQHDMLGHFTRSSLLTHKISPLCHRYAKSYEYSKQQTNTYKQVMLSICSFCSFIRNQIRIHNILYPEFCELSGPRATFRQIFLSRIDERTLEAVSSRNKNLALGQLCKLLKVKTWME